MREFIVGDRVIFVRNPRDYSLGKSNPIQGGPWFCQGEITENDGEFVYVRWDNGESNDYIPECLELVRSVNVITLPEELFSV